MKPEELKEYLSMVVDMEKNIFMQNQTMSQWEQEIAGLGKIHEFQVPSRPKEKSLPETAEWSLAPDVQNTSAKKFFTLPNEIFLLDLPPSAFMVYAYLLLIEDRRTHTCHPSYNTIAATTGMAKNTVMKSIGILLEMSLITMEHSQYFDQRGMKWKGNNLYTILPVSAAMNAFLQRRLDQLELDVERRRVRKQQEKYRRRRPRTALCATAAAQATPDPSSQADNHSNPAILQ